MTDNKALTRFFQLKRIPPKLWNHCDQALQFDFVLTHVPGVENPAADYLSRININPEDRIHLKLNDQIPVHHIEIDLAAKTPKQDEDEEDYDPDQQQPDAATPATHQSETTGPADDFTKMRTLLNSMANNLQIHDDERLKMIQIISLHLEPVLAGDKLNKIERRIYDELVKLREAENLNPTSDDEQRQTFLKNFSWDDSILTEHEQQRIEELLVKYHTIFARHRLDIGINTDFKIKLTPKHDDPVYAQSLPTPTNLKDDLLVELALMQEYGIITTLPYSKYSSPIFAQRKPNGKLRMLVDLRRINHLLKNDYNNHNHPVTTIADAAQHMAGKRYFCKLDCSQPYHCLQMADEQSIQLLAFNFGSRTFAYLRLAQGLNRSLSAFNSTIREYLDALVKADKCAQYVEDIGIAANNVDELIINIEAVFQQIQKAGLKLSMPKCAFGHPKIEFLGRSITTKGIAPLEDKIDKFLNNLKTPTSVKSLQRYIGFVQF